MEHEKILYGVVVVIIGSFCFGTMNVPIRRSKALKKDVIFVQWMMSLGSLIVGFTINVIMGSPPLQLTVTAGGCLWTIANLIGQYVLPNLGIAVSFLLYSTVNILTGWSTGRFGLFGLKEKLPKDDVLNIAGLVTILTGGLAFAFLKREMSNNEEILSIKSEETEKNISKDTIKVWISEEQLVQQQENKNNEKLFDWCKVWYIVVCLFAGIFFSVTVIPVLYIQDHIDQYPNASYSGLNYIFSHYLGVYMSSTIVFIVYAMIKKNRPIIEPGLALPSLGSGAIWGCGMCCLFLGNDLLTQPIAYPVMITIPATVATLWSIFYFKDIKMNFRNSSIIAFSFLLILFGAILSFLSNL